MLLCLMFFFFSSRRRHTRYWRDWSSDVCSSDLAIVFIEVIRGVPLISILFMASIMLPLFMPGGMTVDKLLRAQIAIIIFAAAYIAETVRGGLQAIPRGQHEAAGAMGLHYWQSMRLVVLPQALKIVIPPLVNIFIGFFQDTTL